MERNIHATHHWLIIPKTESRWLSGVVTFLIIAFGAIGIRQMVLAMSGGVLVFNVIFSVIFVTTGIGLWALKNWARILAQGFCFWTMFVMIIGLLNPFTAGDMMARGVDPMTNTPLIVLALVVWSGFWLSIIHILGKYKGSFKRFISAE